MKKVLKKIAELAIYSACVIGMSLASASTGMMEVRIKLMIKNFSYTISIP